MFRDVLGKIPFFAGFIASRLGMTPEALSRSLRALSDLGAIALGADHVSVIDDSLLHEIARQR